jgi:hypothetical protein
MAITPDAPDKAIHFNFIPNMTRMFLENSKRASLDFCDFTLGKPFISPISLAFPGNDIAKNFNSVMPRASCPSLTSHVMKIKWNSRGEQQYSSRLMSFRLTLTNYKDWHIVKQMKHSLFKVTPKYPCQEAHSRTILCAHDVR